MRPHRSNVPVPSTAIAALTIAAGLVAPPAPVIAGDDLVTTVTLLPVRTNTLYEDAGGALAGGHSQYLFAGITGSGSRRRGLVAFDLTGQVPAGGTLQSASLRLHCSQTNSPNVPVELHRVLADWGSGASEPFGNGGGGTGAEAGDATWLHRFYDPSLPGGGTQLWSHTGGDYDAAAVASTPVGISGAFYDWSSPALTTLVGSWATTPADNHGLLVLGDESGFGTAKRFDSQLNTEPSFRAALTLTFLIPAPPHCVADVGVQGGGFGHDGTLDNNDFISFIDLFFSQSPMADLGQQGGIAGSDNTWDNNDFIVFIDAFFNGTGCV